MTTDFSNAVIAIDPGKVTGYMLWVDGEQVIQGQAELWLVIDWVHSIFEGGLRPTLVCEDFIILSLIHI